MATGGDWLGSIGPALAATLGHLRPDTRVAVIVKVDHPVTGDDIKLATSVGAGQVTYVSHLVNAYATSATPAGVQRLAELPGVVEVVQDSPIHIV